MRLIDTAKELFEGVSCDDMTHIPDVSIYNHNYYSINGNLLYGVSDDDNFTQWYWVRGCVSTAIGGSYCTDGDKIIVDYAYT